MNVEEAIAKRHSCRRYSEEPVSDEAVDKLLRAAQAAPSAGGLRPLRVMAIREPETIEGLARAAGQPFIGKAPACIVIAADFQKLRPRYGERGERYTFLEAGHAAQNIALQAVALGLATVMVGAFSDRAVKKILSIRQSPLYIIPLGYKA